MVIAKTNATISSNSSILTLSSFYLTSSLFCLLQVYLPSQGNWKEAQNVLVLQSLEKIMRIQHQCLLLVTHLMKHQQWTKPLHNCKTTSMLLLCFSSKSPSACPLLSILMPQHLTSHVSNTEADLADSLTFPKWFHINR